MRNCDGVAVDALFRWADSSMYYSLQIPPHFRILQASKWQLLSTSGRKRESSEHIRREEVEEEGKCYENDVEMKGDDCASECFTLLSLPSPK